MCLMAIATVTIFKLPFIFFYLLSFALVTKVRNTLANMNDGIPSQKHVITSWREIMKGCYENNIIR